MDEAERLVAAKSKRDWQVRDEFTTYLLEQLQPALHECLGLRHRYERFLATWGPDHPAVKAAKHEYQEAHGDAVVAFLHGVSRARRQASEVLNNAFRSMLPEDEAELSRASKPAA
jgi:hypothetical protein